MGDVADAFDPYLPLQMVYCAPFVGAVFAVGIARES